MKFDYKELIPHGVALIAFLAATFMFFAPQFNGKVLNQGDMVSWRGMANEGRTYEEKTGEVALWTNSMFGGMPAYQISLSQKNNLIQKADRLVRLGLSRPASTIFVGFLCFYIALILLGVSPWLSLVASLLFGLGPTNIINLGAGHDAKVEAVMASAPILAGMVLVMRGKYIFGLGIFTFFLSLALSANHVQMLVYLAVFCSIYMLAKLVEMVRAGKMMDFAKGSGVLLIGALLAAATFSSKLLISNEYAKDTMRGKPILETKGAVTSSSETEGLEWNYAMNYSHNILDAIAGFIPRAAGGSSAELIGKDSQFAKVTGQRRDVRAPLYFGGLPPTGGVYYFGAVVFFLFILGSIIVRGPVKWWLVGAVVLGVLMSMGKYAAWINKPMFDYIPKFNIFRAPNSVLAVTAIFIPILAAMALQKVIEVKDKSTLIKPVLYAAGGLGGFALLYALLGPSMVNLDGPSDQGYAQYPNVVDALMEDRVSYMRSSSFRTLMFVLLGAGLVFAYLKEWINKYVLIGLIALVGLLDIVGVTSRYFGSDNFVSPRNYRAQFEPRPVDTQIKADTDVHYRVHDITTDPWNSSAASYHHKTVGGYHAAKLQRTQDVIDRYLSKGDQAVFNMLNTKYYIVNGQNNQPMAQRNPAALGNGWFVSNITNVNTANEEIDALNGLNPRLTAVVNNEFSDYVNGLQLSGDGTITLTDYTPNRLTYKTSSTGDNLAVFSEVWYGPDKGWQAYIDGQPVDHIRVNYLLRGLKIPAGNHEVVFEFKPALYARGNTISLITSLLVLALLAFSLFYHFKNNPTEEV